MLSNFCISGRLSYCLLFSLLDEIPKADDESKETKEEEVEEKKEEPSEKIKYIPIPIPVPIYVPVPVYMYAKPVPYAVPFPIPTVVPMPLVLKGNEVTGGVVDEKGEPEARAVSHFIIYCSWNTRKDSN